MKKILLSLTAAIIALGAAAQNWSRVVEATMKSELLGVEKSYLVYLPAGYDANPDKKYPVLYLLHGSGDDHTGWRDKGAMKQIADERIESGMSLPMIVVMPDASGEGGGAGGGSTRNRGYFNQDGWPYEDHFFKEFIPHIEKTYRIVGDKAARAVAGLSMGGGGSAAYAQHHPELFSSSCPLSGALGGSRNTTNTSPDRLRNSPTGFFAGATPAQIEALKTVRWFVDSGDDDGLTTANVEFFDLMRTNGIPLQFRVRNGGHNWEYWQTALPEVLTFVSMGFAEGAEATASDAQARPSRSRVVEATMKSDILGREKPYLVYLPEGYDENPNKKYPVLYLLHGASDTHTAWRDKGMMQLIADQHAEAGQSLPMIVVMPDARGEAENNMGTNMGYFNEPGWAYEDHFFTEFIPHIEKTYRIVGDKKHRAVAGLSMGGGGSAGYAQKHPDMFLSACPLSGALTGMGLSYTAGSNVEFVQNATPEQIDALRTVRWWVDCGDDDFLWEANIEFFRAMKHKNIPLQYRMRNGAHNWEYWQTALPDVLTFVSVGFAQ